MRKLSVLFLSLFVIACWSCDDDVEDRPVVSMENAPVLDAPFGNTYVLSPDDPNGLVETFTWDEVTYTEGVVPEYTLEIDLSGNDFSTFQELGSTTNNKLSVTVEALNNVALALEAIPFSENLFEIRLRVNLGTMAPDYAEDIYAITITPYTTERPIIYVVGGFLNASGYGDDWSPASAVPLTASAFGATDFEGFVYINVADAEYKFLPTNVDFSGDYGDTGASNGEYSGIIEQEGEVNCGTPGGQPGYYFITVDTESLTYNLEDASSWAITGSATPLGWPAGPDGTPGQDQDMTYDPVAKTWSVTLDLTAGNEFKFRANDAWAFNYGTDDDGDGSLNRNGPNFTVESSGTYTVTLDLSNPREYTYSITQD